ncbi:MAG: hypothetical protein QGI21_06480 [Candidatus Poseidoniaceae archaeon]|nr:hypothetical protein [Candidatus Poseidoniaceae archaeon]
MRENRFAIGLVVILLLQAFVPTIVSADTHGRTTPDFQVSVLTLSAGGSVDESGQNILAIGDHVLRVVVTNSGPVDGDVSLNLIHRASPSSSETSITTIDLGTIGAGVSTNPILVNWTASQGDGQTIYARLSSLNDINSGNDERSLAFNVAVHQRGIVLGDTVPGPSGGFSDVRLNHTTHTFDAYVRNDGVTPLSAVYELNFTDANNPLIQHSYWSNTLTLEPGSLLYPSNGATLSSSFDANQPWALGTWTMVSRVIFNGTDLWTSTTVSSVETIVFSDYMIDIASPGDRSTEPGSTTSLTWIITNLGSSDNLTIELGSEEGWHDDSQEGIVLFLSVGASTSIVVPVTVPITAVKGVDFETVYLNLSNSQSSPDDYVARSTGHVMVGDLYQARVIAPVGPVIVTPAQTTSLLFTINNSGNVPSAFTIAAGLSAAAENWQVISSVDVTDVIPANSNVTLSVQITPAPISSPLDPGERNSAGDTLNAWISATPVEGGIPSVNSTQLVIRAVIVVDPGPETELIVLTENQVLEANGTGGIDEIIPLYVEARHNLGSGVTGGVDANLTVGSIGFTPSNTGGINEAARWSGVVNPNSVSSLEIGSIFNSWLAIDGPSDELPLAGELVVPITATPILTSSQQSSGVLASPVTRNITIVIPSIVDGEILTTGPLDADVGNQTSFNLKLANTGNDLSSYRLVIMDGLPDQWVATLATDDSSNPSLVTNLSPSMSDHPVTGDSHISNVNLTIITDPQAPADTFQELMIRVEDRDTGEILSLNTLLIRVQESVNFELYPTNHSVSLSPYESPLTRVYVNNTGNVGTTFSIWLDTTLENDVSFSIESPLEIVVGPGYSESIKIRLNPNADASADELHMATLWVEAESGMNLSASIVANISADHDLAINVSANTEVTPGENLTLPVTLINTGNLQESLNVTATIEGDWSHDWEYNQIDLPVDGSIVNDLTIQVPSLGSAEDMGNGDIHNLTITLYDTTDDSILGTRTVELEVAPIFLIEIIDWPAEMNYHRQWSQDWDVTVKNIGNKDVNVNLNYEILKPGLEITSNAWELEPGAPSVLELPVGEEVQLTFTVLGKEFEPELMLEALLRVTLDPTDSEVTGTHTIETSLKMSRLFSYQDYLLQPSEDDGNISAEILWSHIPEGSDTMVSYLIELCGAERRTNLSELSLNEIDLPWTFGINLGENTELLNLHNDCDVGSAGSHSTITLPARDGWHTEDPLNISINPPDRPNILRNDGYDLTFRLYHPDDHNGFSEYTEATFSFYFDTYAEPVITNLRFGEGELTEGVVTTIEATLSNTGTSMAVNVQSSLICDGVTVEEPTFFYPILASSKSVPISWKVRTDNLDWWEQSSDVSCEVVLQATSWNGEIIENQAAELDGQVDSWSMGITLSLIGTLLLVGLAFALNRLSEQGRMFRIASTYAGALGLGFAFHLVDTSWWGPLVLIASIVGVWVMSWTSSEEFQLIHEDYQRARKGISTLYQDHSNEISDTQKQLSVMLSMPILGMLLFVLGLPPQMKPDQENILSLIGFVVVAIGGVILLISRANKMYGNLYGRLTDVEVQASRIERDLGDPARLLTELASDGLDISSIIGESNVEDEAHEAEGNSNIELDEITDELIDNEDIDVSKEIEVEGGDDSE